ncbi:hypothetical protein SAMN05518849_101111 [Sphingobium sp. AP50]|uniref:hypothetical protein n=1 Tax=Sphingobium sp. AP50 TaxID=1884369 RepID=UPI0008C1B955|nr:hypothetical protein [Sphingobium sp. AP50]SEI56854.1 hypothetical protein SAMN05518849_101111 [Sphingobium sp. AP50]
MSIAVQFPDGSVREVPGQLWQVDDPANGQPSFEQIPLNCDSRWHFYRKGRIWRARLRHGHLTALRQPEEAWWEAIAILCDDRGRDEPGQWESAA